jgi:hypothetical protein
MPCLLPTDSTPLPRLSPPPPAGIMTATKQAVDLMTLGVRTRAEGMQRALVASAGGLANNAGEWVECRGIQCST